MNIDANVAQSIVTNAKEALSYNINMFDTRGQCIASTDPARIGSYHEAAALAAQRKERVNVDNSSQFQGARAGINVPVLLNGEVVAVIGITGHREEVEPFSNAIQKMTEILIRENLTQMTRFDRHMMMGNLMSILVHDNPDTALVEYLSNTLHIDMNLPRRMVVGCRVQPSETAVSSEHANPNVTNNTLLEIIEHYFTDCSEYLYSVSPRECCLAVPIRNESDAEELGITITGLQHRIQRECGRWLTFGIGTTVCRVEQYARGYAQALASARWQQFTHDHSVGDFENLDHGLIISSADATAARTFVDHIFAGLSEHEIDEYQSVFDAYTAYNGSIIHAAQSLFIHKNTLQNKLNRIAELTGYNPRELKDYRVLADAFTMRDYLKFQQ